MWAFLSRRFRRWALLFLAIPVSSWVVERLRQRAADSRGEDSRVTRALHHTGTALNQLDRRGGRRRR